MGKVDTNGCEWPKGERLKAAKCREVFPLSFANAQQLPRFTVEPFGALYTLSRSHAFGVFHIAKQYFTARKRNFTLR